MKYPTRTLSLPLWRMIHPLRHREPFSGEGARLRGGRWNAKGVPALYLSTRPETAIAEYYQGEAKPGTLVPYHVAGSLIADLTGEGELPIDADIASASAENWKAIDGIIGQAPRGWTITEYLIADGIEGALVPSTQDRGGANLVLWRWHDASIEGEGAALALLDPDRALAGG